MARTKTYPPLDVLINGRLVGRLEKAASGAISFQYAASWLEWEHRFAVSLAVPLRPGAYRGAAVSAVFENLLPDRDGVRRRLAERMGTSRSQISRLLDPKDGNVTIATLQRAAKIVGCSLRFELV